MSRFHRPVHPVHNPCRTTSAVKPPPPNTLLARYSPIKAVGGQERVGAYGASPPSPRPLSLMKPSWALAWGRVAGRACAAHTPSMASALVENRPREKR